MLSRSTLMVIQRFLRINQIQYPDAPFGAQIEFQTIVTGTYEFTIGENQMA